MNEINYVYQKGAGWVPTYQKPVKQFSLKLNGYLVTVYNRLPELGEVGLNIIGNNFESVKSLLKNRLSCHVPNIGWECTQSNLDTTKQYPDAIDRWCTIAFQKL